MVNDDFLYGTDHLGIHTNYSARSYDELPATTDAVFWVRNEELGAGYWEYILTKKNVTTKEPRTLEEMTAHQEVNKEQTKAKFGGAYLKDAHLIPGLQAKRLEMDVDEPGWDKPFEMNVDKSFFGEQKGWKTHNNITNGIDDSWLRPYIEEAPEHMRNLYPKNLTKIQYNIDGLIERNEDLRNDVAELTLLVRNTRLVMWVLIAAQFIGGLFGVMAGVAKFFGWN